MERGARGEGRRRGSTPPVRASRIAGPSQVRRMGALMTWAPGRAIAMGMVRGSGCSSGQLGQLL
jgi:hypothetical protein